MGSYVKTNKSLLLICFYLLSTVLADLNILVIHDEAVNITDVTSLLENTNQFNSIDTLDINVDPIPTATELNDYGSVFVFFKSISNSGSLGNNLADYVLNYGGGVVATLDSFSRLSGSWGTVALLQGGSEITVPTPVINALEPSHPIFVNGTQSQWGSSGETKALVEPIVEMGATVIADWNGVTEVPFVVIKEFPNGARRVDLNIYPTSTEADSQYGFEVSSLSVVDKIIANSLVWAQKRCISNLELSCPSSIQVSVPIDSCIGTIGDYLHQIGVTGNCSSVTLQQNINPGTELYRGDYVLEISGTDGETSDSCNININVRDSVQPSISCPSIPEQLLGSACNFTYPDFRNEVIVSDNCNGTITITQSPAPGTLRNGAVSELVTWTATDASSNSRSCNTLVNIVDRTPPTLIACPQPEIRNATATCTVLVPSFGAADVTDNCGIVQRQQSPVVFTTLTGAGVYNVSFLLRDNAGNNVTCTSTLTVIDVTPPIITTCASPVYETASTDTCEAIVPNFDSNTVATDACGLTSSNQSVAVGSSVGLGNLTVSVYKADVGGNVVSCTTFFLVTDNTPPDLECPADTIDSADPHTCTLPIPDFIDQINVVEACAGEVNVTQIPSSGSRGLGNYTVNVYGVDASGNSGSCNLIWSVIDTTPPTVQCPPLVELYAGEDCYTGAPNVVDLSIGSDACGMVMLSQNVSEGHPLRKGNHTIELTGTDQSGNTATCQTVVIVIDVTGPTLDCPSRIERDADESCIGEMIDLTALVDVDDNCDEDIIRTQSLDAGETLQAGTYFVVINATDESGNVGTCTIEFALKDQSAPIISECAPSIVVDADASCSALLFNFTSNVNASDGCDPSPSLAQYPLPNTNITGESLTSVVITVTDAGGNQANCTTTFRIVDSTAPVIITCPTNRIGFTGPGCRVNVPNVIDEVEVFDNCYNNPIITQSPSNATLAELGDTEITITVEDLNGNQSECKFNFTLVDMTDPDVSCPQLHSAIADSTCQASIPEIIERVNASDACTEVPELSQSPQPGSSAARGNNSITVTAVDEAGNTKTCTSVFTVVDITAPVLSCPETSVHYSVGATCSYQAPDLGLSVNPTDNCDPSPTLTQSPAAGILLQLGNYTFTITATDEDSNKANCTVEVSIVDDTPPTMNCPNEPVYVNVTTGCAGMMPNLVTLVNPTDNCELLASTSQSVQTGALLGPGSYSVNVTAVDNVGLSTECTITVIFVDTERPDITCPSSLSPLAITSAIPDLTSSATATDNCLSGVTITQNPPSGQLISSSITLTLTATDEAGNSASCAVQVEVSGNQKIEEDNSTSIALGVVFGIVGAALLVAAVVGFIFYQRNIRIASRPNNEIELEPPSQ